MISNTVVLARFGLVAHTSRYLVPERCEFASLCEFNSLGQSFEVLNVFPQSVSRCWSSRRHQRVHFLWFYVLQFFFVHGFSFFETFSSAIKPNCSHSTTQGTGTWENLATWFLDSLCHLWSHGIPLSFRIFLHLPCHFFSSPGPRNLQCTCENFFAYVLTFCEVEIQISSFPFLALQYRWTWTWRWCYLWISQVHCSASVNHPGSSEESAMMRMLGE